MGGITPVDLKFDPPAPQFEAYSGFLRGPKPGIFVQGGRDGCFSSSSQRIGQKGHFSWPKIARWRKGLKVKIFTPPSPHPHVIVPLPLQDSKRSPKGGPDRSAMVSRAFGKALLTETNERARPKAVGHLLWWPGTEARRPMEPDRKRGQGMRSV